MQAMRARTGGLVEAPLVIREVVVGWVPNNYWFIKKEL